MTNIENFHLPRFFAPLLITLLSVLWLGEKVGRRHWLALMIGFVEVLFIVKPGSATFNLGSIFALIFESYAHAEIA